MAYCLPKTQAEAFLKALQEGKIKPDELVDMTSLDRRKFFAGVVGLDNALEVNALFESKILLKDQQRGFVTWAKQMSGLKEKTRTDIVARINKLDRVLEPEEEEQFLADLAAQKLGVTVTTEEAEKIADLAHEAEAARLDMVRSDNLPEPARTEKRIQFGLARQKLTDYVDSLKPTPEGFWWWVSNIGNFPRSIMSTMDFSFSWVQGFGMVGTKEWRAGFLKQFGYFISEEDYNRLLADITTHPDYEIAKKANLSITGIGKKPGSQEEQIQSDLAQEFNQLLTDKLGVPNVIRASGRAFSGFGDYLRYETFKRLINAARLVGEDISPGSKAAGDIATAINIFTGRATLPVRYEKAASVLNTIFFAPRKLAATMEMFVPIRFLLPGTSNTARVFAFKRLASLLVGFYGVYSMAAAMGFKVHLDPRETLFGKIELPGGATMDLLGTNSTFIRLMGRLISGQKITAGGKLRELGNKNFYRGMDQTRGDEFFHFMRGKLSPMASLMVDALYGQDYMGNTFSTTKAVRERLTPLAIGNALEFLTSSPTLSVAIFPTLFSIFGVGLNPPMPRKSRYNRGRVEEGTPEPEPPAQLLPTGAQ